MKKKISVFLLLFIFSYIFMGLQTEEKNGGATTSVLAQNLSEESIEEKEMNSMNILPSVLENSDILAEKEPVPGEILLSFYASYPEESISELLPNEEIVEIIDIYREAYEDLYIQYQLVNRENLDLLEQGIGISYKITLSNHTKEGVLEAVNELKKNPLIRYADANYIDGLSIDLLRRYEYEPGEISVVFETPYPEESIPGLLPKKEIVEIRDFYKTMYDQYKDDSDLSKIGTYYRITIANNTREGVLEAANELNKNPLVQSAGLTLLLRPGLSPMAVEIITPSYHIQRGSSIQLKIRHGQGVESLQELNWEFLYGSSDSTITEDGLLTVGANETFGMLTIKATLKKSNRVYDELTLWVNEPTEAPTIPPTAEPTLPPTVEPTKPPTEESTTSPTETPYILGDINNDGVVDLNDVNLALRAALDIENLMSVSEQAPLIADVNKDGVVDLADVNMILKHALNIEDILK